MLHSRKTSPSEDWFSRVCIHLAFFLALALIWQGGVAIAGKIISYGQEQQVEAINKLVHRLQTGPVDLAESQQIQNTVKEFISAYISAILSFEFFPRNDMELLTKIISATPEEASIEEISFQGRDITIQALCPSLGQVEEMARNLQASGVFSNVVHTFYVDSQGRLTARYTCIALHNKEQTLQEYFAGRWEGLKEWLSQFIENTLAPAIGEELQAKEDPGKVKTRYPARGSSFQVFSGFFENSAVGTR